MTGSCRALGLLTALLAGYANPALPTTFVSQG